MASKRTMVILEHRGNQSLVDTVDDFHLNLERGDGYEFVENRYRHKTLFRVMKKKMVREGNMLTLVIYVEH